MSKDQFEHSVNQELERLNEIIDFKIIHGVSYESDARKHRRLLIQAARAKHRRMAQGFIPNLFSFFRLNLSK